MRCVGSVLESLYCGLARRLVTESSNANPSNLMILRRLGPDPHANGRQSVGANGCPDLFEMTNGDFALIGIDITNEARPHLPSSAGCGPDERIIRIPRHLLVEARADIPESV